MPHALFKFSWLAVLVLSFGILAFPASASDRVLIKMATLAPKGSTWFRTLQEIGREWERLSGGKVVLRLYPGGVVGDERDMIRKMRIRQIQGAALTSLGLSDIDRIIGAFQLPMFYHSQEELDAIRTALDGEIRAAFSEKGFEILNWGDAGWIRFFSKRPLVTPGDLKKAKLFVWSGDTLGLGLLKSLAFNPVALATTDILPGLQTGLIDTYGTAPAAALSFQWFEYTPYMTNFPWAPLVGATVIKRDVWEQIPVALRLELKAVAERKAVDLHETMARNEEEAIAAMVARGLIVVKLDEETKAEWMREMQAAYPRLRDTLVPGPLLDRVIELRRRYRSDRQR